MKTSSRTIERSYERSYLLIGSLLHQIRGDYPRETLCLDLRDLLQVFPEELNVRTELASLLRKPRETWGTVLLATLDDLLRLVPPKPSTRINREISDYLQARRDGDWQKLREIRAAYRSIPEN